MSLLYDDRHYWVNYGTVEYGAQQNLGTQSSFRALPKSGFTEGFNLIKYHPSTTDSSSPVSTKRSLSVSERTALDERSSQRAGPFNPARTMYPPQMQQTHTQPAKTHFQSWGFDQRYRRPWNYYYQPIQMVVTSPSYWNMVPIQSPVSSMAISQPRSGGTSQVWNSTNYQTRAMLKNTALKPVFTSQHTIIDPPSISSVADSSQPCPILISSNSSATLENFVSSPHMRSYNVHAPVLSPAFSVGALEVPPVMQFNRKDMQAKDSQDHNSCTSTDPMALSNGVASVKTANVCNIPCRALMTLKSPSQIFSGQASVNNEVNMRKAVVTKEDDDLWPGSCTYAESEQNSGATLFVTWFSSRALLVGKLRHFKLEVKHVRSTSDNKVFNVVFEGHACARKAFTMQRTIRVRMVPPKKSNFKWLRNPSPKFLVKFETMRPMIIRNGKSETGDIVGILLLSKLREEERCFVWADQLKGHRIRIVACKGSLKYKDGTVLEMTGISNKLEGDIGERRMQSLGWVSYRSKYTNEMFVKRRSGNLLSDYIYRG